MNGTGHERNPWSCRGYWTGRSSNLTCLQLLMQQQACIPTHGGTPVVGRVMSLHKGRKPAWHLMGAAAATVWPDAMQCY